MTPKEQISELVSCLTLALARAKPRPDGWLPYPVVVESIEKGTPKHTSYQLLDIVTYGLCRLQRGKSETRLPLRDLNVESLADLWNRYQRLCVVQGFEAPELPQEEECTWLIVEALSDTAQHVHKVLRSACPPLDAFRQEILSVARSYDERNLKLPDSVMQLCKFWAEEDAAAFLTAMPGGLDALFSQVESRKKVTYEFVSLQRAVWCSRVGLDVLEYSYMNNGGSEPKLSEIVSNPRFHRFRKQYCIVKE